MSNPYADFETDTDLERNGGWMDVGAYRIKIAASGSENPEFMTCYAEKLKPIRHALATKKLDDGMAAIHKEVGEIRAELDAQQADLAAEIASKVLGRTVSSKGAA